jgi:hypothetical protein
MLSRPGLRIERIVSLGQTSPSSLWYDREEGEWVLLRQVPHDCGSRKRVRHGCSCRATVLT